MKRLILVLIAVIFVLSLLLHLFPFRFFPSDNQIHNGDWAYDLPNDYTIWHINSKEIVLGHYNTANSISTVIEDTILRFCYNDCFVCIQINNRDGATRSQNSSDMACYYIINTNDGAVHGPFTWSEYEESLVVYEVNNLTDWISTKPAPEGSTYGH